MSDRADSLQRLEQEVAVMVRRIRRVLAERAHAVHPDLQPAALLLLGYVAADGPLRSSVLVCAFNMDKGAISRHVQHMVELELLERTPDPDDGRASLLGVTEEGARRLAVVDRERRHLLGERLSGWSASDLQTFVDLLARYNGDLNEIEVEAKARGEVGAPV